LTELAGALLRIQHQLFNLGSLLATLPEDVHPRQPRIRADDSEWLEQMMDRCNARLEPLRTFVLPGGHRANTDLHVCRTVARRVERRVVALAEHAEVDPEAIRYLNRLSDAFFVFSRAVVFELQAEEALWRPNAATGADE
jgi:cob(I)alamin adenosyltransferase